jgi:hypothetical protein
MGSSHSKDSWDSITQDEWDRAMESVKKLGDTSRDLSHRISASKGSTPSRPNCTENSNLQPFKSNRDTEGFKESSGLDKRSSEVLSSKTDLPPPYTEFELGTVGVSKSLGGTCVLIICCCCLIFSVGSSHLTDRDISRRCTQLRGQLYELRSQLYDGMSEEDKLKIRTQLRSIELEKRHLIKSIRL